MSSKAFHNHTDILLEVGTNELEIIEFTTAGQHFGVNVAKVKQVVRWQEGMCTRVNDAPECVMGVIYYRGKPVTLIDLRKALRIENAPPADSSRLLILVTQFNDVFTAYLIDKVNRIHRVSWERLEPFKEIVPGVTSYVTGTVTIDDRVLMVLDLEHMMSFITPHLSIQASHRNIESVAINPRRGDVCVLFAEDSAIIRKMTSEQLRTAGFDRLVVYEDGQRAYDAIVEMERAAKQAGKRLEETLHLLLTDIEMPRMDGLTLCKKFKQEMGHHKIPVVMYSSLINEQMANKCKAVGSDAHISKPKIHQIVETIDRLCRIST